MWYECKVAYMRQSGEGERKKVTEQYLVNAQSCSEAESSIELEIMPYVSSGEIEVKSIKEYNVSDVFAGAGGGTYYKARLEPSEPCSITGRPKVTPYIVIVESGLLSMRREEIEVAIDLLKHHMRNTLSDWELVKIERTPLMGIIVPETSEGL